MKRITAGELAAIVRGELVYGSPGTPVAGIGDDSRKIPEGFAFLAIKGGNSYIDGALDAGASGCVFDNADPSGRAGKFFIRVKDSVAAYKYIAAWHRAHFDIPVVQVTGSVGKTTTKDMIAGVLSQHFKTLKTEQNFNNEIGTPRTLLKLEEGHEAAVVETGMDGEGQIRYLGEMVKPTVAVITNIGDMHIEFLGSRENILKAKCEIFENLAPDGLVVLNGDDELLGTVKLSQRTIRVGKGEGCDARISGIADRGIDGVKCTVTTKKTDYRLDIPAPGAHMTYPAAMAVVIGEELGMTPDEIVRGVAEYEPSGARMRVHELDGGRKLIDDCYNAGPQSVRAALEVLAGAEGRTVAVLGDMAELGELTEKAHSEIGQYAKELGIDRVIAVGTKAKGIADAARDRAEWYESVDEALEMIKEAFSDGTTMLVKASHSMKFERITEELVK